MKNDDDIYEFVNSLKGPSTASHLLLWFSLLFILCFFTWAYFAKLEEITHSEGKVIPSQRIQLIQNLEGGIVREILVHEGQIVEADQVMMKLDQVQFYADYKENDVKLSSFEAKYEMLDALVNNKPYQPSEQHLKTIPSLIKTEQALYNSKTKEMDTLLENKYLVEREIAMTRPLVKSGSVSEVEVIRLEKQLGDNSHLIHQLESENLDELNTTKIELNKLRESMDKVTDRLNRTVIKSPVKGIINKLHVNTIGGVIQPGQNLIEIVPLDNTLLIEAKVKPSDIGFIHPGQNAVVKISAFDFSIYGGLEGNVEHISADTSTENQGNDVKSYYYILVRTDKNYLERDNKKLRIIPGMTATVDILTGEKTVFDYIMKPILKTKQKALTER